MLSCEIIKRVEKLCPLTVTIPTKMSVPQFTEQHMASCWSMKLCFTIYLLINAQAASQFVSPVNGIYETKFGNK